MRLVIVGAADIKGCVTAVLAAFAQDLEAIVGSASEFLAHALDLEVDRAVHRLVPGDALLPTVHSGSLRPDVTQVLCPRKKRFVGGLGCLCGAMNLFGFVPGYGTHIYDSGREPAFLVLLAFILTLGARGSTPVWRGSEAGECD